MSGASELDLVVSKGAFGYGFLIFLFERSPALLGLSFTMH